MARRFVIIGNGVAGITAAMTLRARDPEARITVVGEESPFFFARTALMYAFMHVLERRAMEPFARGVYRDQRITLVHDRVTDLDAAARSVTTERGDTLAWDGLVLAVGSSPRALAAPGVDDALQGLVHFVSLRDLDACERWTPSTREAVVVGGGLLGVELVECLVHHGVKTRFLVREPGFWPIASGREEGELLTAHLRARGVDVRRGAEIASVERDAAQRVRAVLTRDGLSHPCQLLGVTVGVEPAVDFLRRVTTPPAIDRGVRVDATLRSSLDGVWAAGDCAAIARDGLAPRLEQTWYSAKRQGEHVARNLTGRPAPYAPPTFFNSAKLFDVEYTTVGELTEPPAGARSVLRRDPDRLVTQRIVHHEGRVIGFNMLGSRWDHTLLARWIDEGRTLDWTLAHLRAAQFDVELGRVDLRALRELDLPFAPVTED